jgi:hypothetical protein
MKGVSGTALVTDEEQTRGEAAAGLDPQAGDLDLGGQRRQSWPSIRPASSFDDPA